MRHDRNVPKAREFIKEVVRVPGRFCEIVRLNVQEFVEQYLNYLMEAERTFFLGRGRYERPDALEPNYRNGFYSRRFILKGIGPVMVRIPIQEWRVQNGSDSSQPSIRGPDSGRPDSSAFIRGECPDVKLVDATSGGAESFP